MYVDVVCMYYIYLIITYLYVLCLPLCVCVCLCNRSMNDFLLLFWCHLSEALYKDLSTSTRIHDLDTYTYTYILKLMFYSMHIHTYIDVETKWTSYMHTTCNTHTNTYTPTRIANYLQNNEVIKWIFLIHLIEDIMKLCYFLARCRFHHIDTDSKRVRAPNAPTHAHARIRIHMHIDFWIVEHIHKYIFIYIYIHVRYNKAYTYTHILNVIVLTKNWQI